MVINKPFKSKITELWQEWILQTTRNARGRLVHPTRQDVLNWISEAWDAISEDMIIRAFKKCGISNNTDGSEEHLVSSDIPQLDQDATSSTDSEEEDEDEEGAEMQEDEEEEYEEEEADRPEEEDEEEAGSDNDDSD